MILEPIKPEILAVRIIPNVEPQLAKQLQLEPRHRAIGMLTCTIDDALYAALDEGTKAAPVDVVYAKSFYAGAAHASGPFSGEIIGIFAGEEPESVSSSIQASLRYLQNKAWFYSANDKGNCAFFPHVIPRTGRYLSAQAGVEPGTPMAYLIAPPIEAMLALDAALKAAEVEMRVFYAPPSETNFAGALLTGEQHEVEAAALAFQETVLDLAARPHVITPAHDVESLAETFGRKRALRGAGGDAPYRLFGSGMGLDTKPDAYTHLFDNQSLVHKSHPVIRFRGQLDLLQAHVLDAAVEARREGLDGLGDDLDEVLAFLRKMLSAEVMGTPMPTFAIAGFDGEELHRISHNTKGFLNVGWVMPASNMGPTIARLNLLRAFSRQVELLAMEVFETSDHLTEENRAQMLHGLNRLSNAIYVLVCKAIATRKKEH
jgi:ethanolamine utilization protein EutL